MSDFMLTPLERVGELVELIPPQPLVPSLPVEVDVALRVETGPDSLSAELRLSGKLGRER